MAKKKFSQNTTQLKSWLTNTFTYLYLWRADLPDNQKDAKIEITELAQGLQERMDLVEASTDLSDMPTELDLTNAFGEEKLVFDKSTGKYVLRPSTTAGGFYDASDIELTFDGTSIHINPVIASAYKFVSADYKEYEKATDSYTPVFSANGLYFIYYDNNGNLQQFNQPSIEQQLEYMRNYISVAYILYNADGPFTTISFVGNYIKQRDPIDLWLKNFYDIPVYAVSGVIATNIPVGATGNLNSDVQIGLTSGQLLFVSNKYSVPQRLVTDTWNVGWTASNTFATGFPASPYLAVTDTQIGVGSTGRICKNNNGNPIAVTSGRYVWYFIFVTVDITGADRTLSFMGENGYSNEAQAISNLNSEVATVENKQRVKQGAQVRYAVLLQTSDGYSNAIKSRIVQIQAITKEGQNSAPISNGVTWGSIDGTLSDQTDLQAALDAKAPAVTGTDGADVLTDGAGGLKTSANSKFNTSTNTRETIGLTQSKATSATRQKLFKALTSGDIEVYSVDSEGIIRIKAGGVTPVGELGYISLKYNDVDDTWVMYTNSGSYILNRDTLERLNNTATNPLHGSQLMFNADTQIHEFVSSAVDDSEFALTTPSLTSQSALADILPAGYVLDGIFVKNNGTATATGVKFGTTLAGVEIYDGTLNIAAGAYRLLQAHELSYLFNTSADTALYQNVTGGYTNVNLLVTIFIKKR